MTERSPVTYSKTKTRFNESMRVAFSRPREDITNSYYSAKPWEIEGLGQYIEDMFSRPRCGLLLTARQELACGKRISLAKGIIESERAKDAPDELVVARAENKMEKARERLTDGNYCLVFPVAKRYSNLGLDLRDLVQEGNMGLLKAVSKYDYKKDNRFSTYAPWWIRHFILEALNKKGRPIPLDDGLAQLEGRIRQVKIRMFQQQGYQPTTEEIAAILKVNLGQVEKALKHSYEFVSINERNTDDKASEEIDSLTEGYDLESEVCKKTMTSQIKKEVRDLVNTLEGRKREVVVYHYGLDGDSNNSCPQSLERIGERWGVTREAVRQTEMRAFKKLREHPLSEKLRELI